MNTDAVGQRVERFERTVALCVCVVPFLFSVQLVLVALSAPTFAAMFADFGAELPLATQVVLDRWPLGVVLGCVLPIASLVVAIKGRTRVAVVLATMSGLVAFAMAQVATMALFLPIFHLGAVSGQ